MYWKMIIPPQRWRGYIKRYLKYKEFESCCIKKTLDSSEFEGKICSLLATYRAFVSCYPVSVVFFLCMTVLPFKKKTKRVLMLA